MERKIVQISINKLDRTNEPYYYALLSDGKVWIRCPDSEWEESEFYQDLYNIINRKDFKGE